jgi:hypothetical protein
LLTGYASNILDGGADTDDLEKGWKLFLLTTPEEQM